MTTTLKDEIGKRQPFATPEEEAYLSILKTMSVLEAPFARLFKSRGLSEPTYNILRILRGHAMADSAHKGIPCQTIAAQLISRLPDVTRLVDRLEAAGLVKRSRTPDDRRVVLVSITKKGQALLAEIDKPAADLQRSLFRHMSKAELADLIRLLARARNQGD